LTVNRREGAVPSRYFFLLVLLSSLNRMRERLRNVLLSIVRFSFDGKLHRQADWRGGPPETVTSRGPAAGIGAVSRRHAPEHGVVVTAHRGASGLMPENTLGAVALAMEFGADFAEVDVHLTGDGEVVLLHDDSLWRTTNGRGKIWEYTFRELSKLDAGSWYGPQFGNERIPTLREVIRLVKGKMKLDIEIKSNSMQKDLPRRVMEVLQEEDFLDQCVITSFDRDVLVQIREFDHQVLLGLISSVGLPTNVHDPCFDWFMGHSFFIDAEIVTHLHSAGKQVHVWTVNRPLQMRRFIRLGVDGIITDRPDLLKKILEKQELLP